MVKEASTLSVGEYLQVLNTTLYNVKGRILGEIVNLKMYEGRSYMYFSIKDKEEGKGMINCFMWKRNYALCGVDLEDGMEVVIYGYSKIYEPNGSLSFQTETVELVGEGALKKAYDMLKLKLEKEEILSDDRKRSIPEYPAKIGVITSRDGAVLSDFTTNVGSYGYHIHFVNSRVEGQIAVSDLISAVKTLRKQNIDVLVIMRGGGSLESFMAFNNEKLVRMIADFPVPVIAGIGHDKDICLVSLAADRMVSTPTAAAQLLNKSWDLALSEVKLVERHLYSSFEGVLREKKKTLEYSAHLMINTIDGIFRKFKDMQTSFRFAIKKINYQIQSMELQFNKVLPRGMNIGFQNMLRRFDYILCSREKELQLLNPERQLKLGYSIVRYNGKILNTVNDVKVGDELTIKMYDGELKTNINGKGK